MKTTSNMAYRFTDSSKWQGDGWFIDLKPFEKLTFMYLCDNCDIAGFIELSLKKLCFDLSLQPEEVKASLKGLERSYILSIDRRTLFLKNFIKHQKNLPLNPDNKAHKGIFKRFEMYKEKFNEDLIQIASKGKKVNIKGLPSPTGIGNGIIQFVDYNKGIEFENFWNLYNKKIGDKPNVKKKWDSLNIDIQKKVIEMLPNWKLQFDSKKFQPHPETYLNQQRWNDEIISGSVVKSGGSPDKLKSMDDYENKLAQM